MVMLQDLVALTSSDTLDNVYAIGEKLGTALLGAAVTLVSIWLKNRKGIEQVELQHTLDRDRIDDEEAARIRNELRSDLNIVREQLKALQVDLENERRVKLHLLEQIMFLQARSKLIQNNSENILAWLRAKSVDVPESLFLSIPDNLVIDETHTS